jgi:methionyl-tRNA synthetase
LKILFTPFLPFSSQRLHELLGYDGYVAGPLEFRREVEEGGSHEVLTGEYGSWMGRWEPSALAPGQRLSEPEPLFRKLDPALVDEELRRMSQDADAA